MMFVSAKVVERKLKSIKKIKMTETKKSRAIIKRNENGKFKVVGYRPATPRHVGIINWEGMKLKVLIAPGQRINARKEYKRQYGRAYTLGN